MHHVSVLEAMDACPEAIEWLGHQTSPTAAWRTCKRGDWMLWVLGHLSGPPDSASRRRLVVCARGCAREAWRYVSEAAGETALSIAFCDHLIGEYLAGHADLEDLRAVKEAASVASVAMTALAESAAAWAVEAVAETAMTPTTTSSAAWASAWAAMAVASAAAGEVVWTSSATASLSASLAAAAALRRCAQIVRHHYPKPPDLEYAP